MHRRLVVRAIPAALVATMLAPEMPGIVPGPRWWRPSGSG